MDTTLIPDIAFYNDDDACEICGKLLTDNLPVAQVLLDDGEYGNMQHMVFTHSSCLHRVMNKDGSIDIKSFIYFGKNK